MADMSAAYAAIKQYNMIQKGNTVIVALSGGADSVALFHFLFTRQAELGFSLEAANVDHGMRGEASRRDSEYVSELCREYGVKLHHTSLGEGKGKSEEYARKARYAFFDSLLTADNVRIATAHTASDNAETVILNMCRGTSLRGAGGIPPVRGEYIRPFIYFTRADTEQYCYENSLKYVIDETNLTAEYARGRVRNNIMPLLNTVHKGADTAIARFAASARKADDYIAKMANEALNAARLPDGVSVARFISEDAYELSAVRNMDEAVLDRALETIMHNKVCANAELIARARELVYQDGASMGLTREYNLVNMQNALYVEKSHCEALSYDFALNEGNYPLFDDFYLEIKCTNYENFVNNLNIQEKDLIFCADYGNINDKAYFRTRKSGDIYRQAGRGLGKTMKKLMNETAIAHRARGLLPVLAIDSEVLWSPCGGFAEGLEPAEDTAKVLIVMIKHKWRNSR